MSANIVGMTVRKTEGNLESAKSKEGWVMKTDYKKCHREKPYRFPKFA